MKEMFHSLDLHSDFTVTGKDCLPSKFAVTDLATWSFGAVGSAIVSLANNLGLSHSLREVKVDRRLASLWFGFSIQPIDWQLPPIWDAIAGDYQAQDGWIKLHTNLDHHRQAALSVLGVKADRTKVAEAVLCWKKEQLESAIVEAGGAAAAMRTRSEWLKHPQGKAVSSEPLICWQQSKCQSIKSWQATTERPLNGLKVLDLTRVLAGPVATRTLAAFGANVLRLDPPCWDEANIVPDITLGKRCANLNLNNKKDRDVFETLLAQADVLVHGYRPGALNKLGYSPTERNRISPALIEVCLDTYGWTGPWSHRRGFDSLVQMSTGIAEAGMDWAKQQKPTPLPVQALDHATGYLMAAAAIKAIDDAISGNGIKSARLSLARTAELLFSHPQAQQSRPPIELRPSDFSPVVEATPWGKAKRLKPAIHIEGMPMKWDSPACELGSSKPVWN